MSVAISMPPPLKSSHTATELFALTSIRRSNQCQIFVPSQEICWSSNQIFYAQLYSARHKAKEKVDKIALRLAAELVSHSPVRTLRTLFPCYHSGEGGWQEAAREMIQIPSEPGKHYWFADPGWKIKFSTR